MQIMSKIRQGITKVVAMFYHLKFSFYVQEAWLIFIQLSTFMYAEVAIGRSVRLFCA